MAVTYTPTQRELIAMSSFVELGIKKAPTKEARDRELEKFIAFAKENADLMTDLPTLSAEISQLLKITADSEEAAGQVPVSITNRILERVKFRSQAPLLIAELSQGAGFEDVSVGLQKQFGELNQTLQLQLEGFFAALPTEIQTTTPEQAARLNLGLSQAQDMLNRMYEARGSLYGSQVR
jgi:hypothetical protein